MTPATLRAILAGAEERRTLAIATRLSDGAQFLSDDPAIPREVAGMAAGGRTQCAEIGGARWFVQVFAPAPRVLIVGAVHVAQCLAPMARLAGYDVTVVDPRGHFATAERFPGTGLLAVWPDDPVVSALMDAHTAVVTLSHNPRIDDPALTAALYAGCFYVGGLGSARTHAARLDRFRAAGIAEDRLAAIRGPVGLPLGSSEAPDIAVSILAEIIAVRRGAALARR